MYPNNNCNDCPDCPGTITPLPLPDLSGLCGDEYDAACVIYTGEDIACLGIESGMSFLEVLNIFNNALPICDCCAKVNCVVSDWGPFGPCKCYYNEEDVLVCGRSTSIRTIITPPQFGGTPCPPLVDYKACTIPPVCFTFGSYICETDPNPTQILASPAGLLDDKPYYLLEFTCGAPDLYVWYNITTSLWHITPTLNVTNALYQTLNNGGNYLPISNDTTQRWSFVEGGDNYLIATQTTTCPDIKICFKYTILLLSGQLYTYYTYVAPTNLGDGSFPQYSWSINTPDGMYNMSVQYDNDGGWIMFYQIGINDPAIGSTLDTDTFNPVSTSVIQWETGEEPPVAMQLSTLGGPCVQPPDVPCVIDCGEWSDCIGGTRTKICVVTTPPSGNVPPCPPLIETEPCEIPFCFPPTNVVPTEDETNVIVTFTGVSGADYYEIVYTLNGVPQTNVTGPSSPLLLPHECSGTYVGTIVTHCTNGLVSSEVPFTFESRDAEIIYRNEIFSQLLINTGHSFSPNGLVLYITLHNSGMATGAPDTIRSYNLGTAWDVSTIIAPPFAQSIAITQYTTTEAGGHCWGDGGRYLYVCGSNSNVIIRYTLGTLYDLTTTSHVNNDFYQLAPPTLPGPLFVDFSHDGLSMFVTKGTTIRKYNLAAPWVISTGVNVSTILTLSNTIFDLSFQNNGSLLFYMISISGVAYIVKRTLLTPYDIGPGSISAPETTSLGAVISSVLGTGQNLLSLSFEDGFKFFVSGYNGTFPNRIRAFELTCEYDISGPLVIIT